MNLLLHLALTNVLLATLLAVVAAVVGRFCRRPALSHGLWLLVLLKLVTPPLVRVPLPWPTPQPASSLSSSATLSPTESSTPAEAPATESGHRLPRGREMSALPLPSAGRSLDNGPATAPVLVRTVGRLDGGLKRWAPLLCGLWLAGSLLAFGVAAWRVGQFQRLLRHACPAPGDLQAQAAQLAQRLGLRHCPGVWLLPGPLAPMLWVVGGAPRLLFPRELLDRLTHEERRTLLAHELAHLRRGDHWVRWLELTCLGCYWWYPLLGWVRQQLRAAEEECCDAWVVQTLPGANRAYAHALLATIDFLSEPRSPLPALASRFGEVRCLKRRLSLIVRAGTPRHMSPLGQVAVFGLGLLLLPLAFTPAPWAQESRVEASRPAVVHEEPVGSPVVSEDNPLQLEAHPTLLPQESVPSPTESPAILGVAFSPDSRTLAVARQDRVIQLYDATTLWSGRTLTGHSDVVAGVVFSPNGQLLASASNDHTARLWDLATGQELRTFRGHTNWVFAVVFSPDGQTLATAGYDRTVRLWDVSTGQEKATLRGHRGAVRCLAFSPNGQRLASGGADGSILVWDPDNQELLTTLRGHRGAVRALAFAPDGKTLASGSEDRRVLLWDVAGWQPRLELQGHEEMVLALAYSSGGRTLTTACLDGAVSVWDPRLGNVRFTSTENIPMGDATMAFTCVAIAPNGWQMAGGGYDRVLRLWRATLRGERALPPAASPPQEAETPNAR